MSSSIQNHQRPGSSMGTQPSIRSQQQPQNIFNPPPPYRAPPTPAGGNGHQIQQFSPMSSKHKNMSTAFSKFNSSEPNVSGNPALSHQPPQNNTSFHNGLTQPTSPAGNSGGYRHTINHENSQQVQHGLRNMMQQPTSGGPTSGLKHSTLDSAGQNMALNHLRNSGITSNQHQNGNIFQANNKMPVLSSSQTPATNGDSTYISADNLRDAANRLFTRNQGDRSSFGTLTTAQQNHQAATQQQVLQQHMQRFSSVRGIVTPSTNYNNITSPLPSNTPTNEEKRNSYTNQSFRKALGSPQQMNSNQTMQSTAPIVPPKPSGSGTNQGSNKDITLPEHLSSFDQDTTLDAELKNILRAGGNSASLSFLLNQSGQRLSVGPNGTPPLPALSPGPMPSHLYAQMGLSMNDDPSVNHESLAEMSSLQRNGNNYIKQQGNANSGKVKHPTSHSPQKPGGNRPDLLGNAPEATLNSSDKVKNLLANANATGPLRRSNIMENIHLIKDPKTGKVIGGKKLPIPVSNISDANGMTPGAKDLEQMIGMVGGGMTDITSEDYEEDGASTMIEVGDAAAIRRQLDGLENMYTEVLRLLGLRKFGRQYDQSPGNNTMHNPISNKPHHTRRNKMYGSMSSLPSVSSIGSRLMYKEKQHHSHQRKDVSASASKRPGSAGGTSKEKNYNKRFQRLESHVVTLARSVANLSSEIRSQQVLVQEVESLKAEMHQLRMSQSNPNAMPRNPSQNNPSGHLQFDSGRIHGSGTLATNGIKPAFYSIHANRVRKLTQFFGEEPPLVKQFLKNLGYEKYASIFEEARIGMLELPYLTEDRLEKLGIPTGPRLRIVQEAKASVYGVKQTPISSSGNQNSNQIMPVYQSTGGQPHVPSQQQHNNNPSAAATVGGGVSNTPHEQNYNVYIL